VPCECCGKKGTEIHHILARSKEPHLLNDIHNIQSICRTCHQEFGDRIYLMPMLLKIHKAVLRNNGIEYDNNWFEFYITKYENLKELKE
jgi:hypothetical protein